MMKMLFKKKLVIFIFLFVILSNLASAAEISLTDPVGIGKYEQPSGYTGSETDNLFIYSDGSSLYWDSYALLGGSATVSNLPYGVSDVCADYNYIYVVFYNGLTYRIPNSLGLQSWDTISAEDVESLGDFSTWSSTGDAVLRIDTDAAGNIYVSDANSRQIYYIDGDTLASTTYQSGFSSYASYPMPIFCGNHFYMMMQSSNYGDNADWEIFTVDSIESEDYLFTYDGGTAAFLTPGGVSELTNGNLVVCYYLSSSGATRTIKEFYPNGTVYGTISAVSQSDDSYMVSDIVVLSNGVVVACDSVPNYLRTYMTSSASGGYFVPTAPEEEASSPDTSSSYIQFEHDSYVSGEKAKITYSITDSDWTDSYAYIGYDFDIQILDPSGNEIYTYDLPAQNGSTYFQFYIQYEVLENGPYTVNLVKSWLGNLDSSIIATDRTTLGDYSDSTIDVVPLTVNYGENFSIKYTYGFNPNTTVIKLMSKDDSNTNMWTTRYTIPVEADANTEFTITAPELYITGEWLAGLYGNGNLLDSDTFTVYKEYSNVITTVYNSSVIISPESFIMGEYVNGRSAISDDAMEGGNDIYLQFVNLDEDLICFSVPMPYQIQTFNFKLGDFDYWEYTTGDSYYVGDHSTIAGNNQIRLAAYSGGSLVEVLATDNFSVTSTNTAGYGLTLSSSEVGQNEQFIINVIAPDDCSLYLSKIGSVSNTHIASWDFNGSVSFPYSLVVTGNYQFTLTDGNDRIQATQYLIVTDSGSSYSGYSDDYTSSGNWGNDIITNLITFLTLPAFWGFILWSGLTIGMIQRRDRNGNAIFDLKQVGIVSVLACNLLAIAGLWRPYTWYVVIVSWLLLAIGFYGVGRKFSGDD
ncbi:hypothetical protein RE474_09605 [Methanolobus sediminis]|uniref:Uncharacterized protein n=1 Tax=Methanolobus sediminis TaxID=3072978 RepID=A0AA51YKW1_9EURY|nr:hypothetical protein [Methanolobus sediminis]WMW24344.1 hypothetical protein RE474_09605 [Methanolobus sediminis]